VSDHNEIPTLSTAFHKRLREALRGQLPDLDTDRHDLSRGKFERDDSEEPELANADISSFIVPGLMPISNSRRCRFSDCKTLGEAETRIRRYIETLVTSGLLDITRAVAEPELPHFAVEIDQAVHWFGWCGRRAMSAMDVRSPIAPTLNRSKKNVRNLLMASVSRE